MDAVNDAPTAVDDDYATDEDTLLSVAAPGVLGNDTDIDGGPLTAVLVAGPTNGLLTLNADGSFDYTPNLNFNGMDSFTYRAFDGSANSNVAIVDITVNSVNDAPVCVADSGSTNEDVALVDSVTCTDVDGGSLSYAVIDGVASGVLSFATNGSFTYTPDADFNGTDGFTFRASDGLLNSNTVAYSIIVNAVNDAPTCDDPQSDSTDEDTTLNGAVLCDDIDADTLTYSLVDDVSNGTLTFNPDGTFSYSPDADFNGLDSFTFSANDGALDSNAATFDIIVNAVNDAPTCDDPQSDSTDEDTTLNGAVLCDDIDADTLTYSLVDDVSNGTLTFNPDGTFSYSPDADFNGLDSFTFSANDGALDSNAATFDIIVNAVNDAPTCDDPQSDSTDEDTTLNGAVLCDDIDADTLTYSLVDDVSNGTLTFNPDGTFSYSPDADFNGLDSFTFSANDGALDSNAATFDIIVNAVNDAPTCDDPQSDSTDEDTTLNGAVLCDDIDADTLTYSLVDDVSNGTLTFNPDGTFSYSPDADFNGLDSFTFSANDGALDSNAATFDIIVNAVNDAPTCDDPQSDSTDEDTTLNGAVLCDDIDADTLTYSLVDDVSNGTLTFNPDGTFSYSPDADFNGLDSFTFSANDGALDSNAATFDIIVNAVNDAPTCDSDSGMTDEDTQLVDSVLCSDVDGDALTILLDDDVADGSLSLSASGTFSYTPDSNFNGSDGFTFHASDGSLNSALAAYDITVTEVNDAPVAADDSATVAEDGSVNLDPRDGDSTGPANESGQSLTIISVSDPANGTATLEIDGTVTYEPDLNFNGTDSFTYVVQDDGTTAGVDDFLTDEGEVTITVTEVNDAPVAADDSATVAEDGSVNLDPRDGDSTGPANESGQSLTIISVSDPANGTATLEIDGTVTYEPDLNFNGTDSFTYVVQDDGTTAGVDDFLTDEGEVTITVTEVNDAPVAADDSATVAEDGSVNLDPRDGDSTGPANESGQSLTIISVSDPANGTATLEIDGTVTYEPDLNFNGTDSFTYVVQDDGTTAGVDDFLTDEGEVTITVTEVNDAPVAADDSATVAEDGSVNLDPRDGDSTGPANESGQSLTIISVSDPANGTATLEIDGTVTYEPDLNFNGTDSFTYVVQDDGTTAGVDDFLTDEGEVTITVTEVNDAPVAADDSATVAEDGSVNLDPRDGDSTGPANESGQSLTIISVSDPANGTATLEIDGTVTYEPDLNFNGTDSFTYVVQDDGTTAGVDDFLTDEGEVTITVTEVNDAPVAADDSATVAEDGSVNLDPRDGDSTGPANESGQSLTIISVSDPANGTATLEIDGTVTYEPDLNFNGTDSFTYVVQDDGTTAGVDDFLTDEGEVTITVTEVNDAPVAADDSATVAEDGSVNLDPRDGDSTGPANESGQSLTIISVSDPANGTATLEIDGTVTYEPDLNFNGTDSFTYVVQDDGTTAGVDDFLTDEGEVTITVTEVNDAPVVTAGSDQAIIEGGIASVDATFTDVDSGQTHTCSIDWDDGSSSMGLVVEPSGSTPGMCTGSHTYPDDDPTGTSSDEYAVLVTIVDDGTTNGAPDPRQDTASPTVTVSNVAPAVTLSGDTAVNEGGSLNYTYTWTDPGTDSWTHSISCGTSGVASLDVFDELSKSGSFTCSWADDSATPQTVSVNVTDDDTGTDTKSKSVTVSNVAPTIAISGAASVNEGSPYSLTLGAVTDPGTDTVTSYIVHWGDGNSDTYGTNGVKTHTYADGPATPAITVDLVDEDGTHLNRANAKSVSVLNVAPSTPSLVSPANGAITNDNTPTFDWSDSTDPAGANDTISYSLQVDNNGCGFPSPEIDVSGLGASTYTPATAIPDSNAYCWRVWASDEDGGIGAYSATRALTIDATVPTVGITFPLSAAYSEASWNSGCVPLTGEFCGSASDATSGISQTQVSIRRFSTGLYWSGTAFNSAAEVLFNVGNGGSWLQAFQYSNFPSTGQYTIRAQTTDNATNTSSTSVTFQLNRYTLDYQSPIDDSTPSTIVLNTGKNGRVIPVKIRVYLEGVNQSSTQIAQGRLEINVNSTNCASGAVVDGVELYADAGASNGNTNDFRPTGDHWIYNLDTKALGLVTNQCYRLDVYLDGVRISTQQFAVFKPTK